MCCSFIQSSFSGLKTALPPLMPSSVKRGDQLVAREQLLIGAGRPAEQREEVHHRLGQVALLAYSITDVAPCRLLSRFLSGPRISGTCANCGVGRAERLEQQHLLRRVRDVIVAAHDVRDLHVEVVGDDGEVVGRVAVGAQDDEVLDVGVVERDRAVHEIGERRGALGHVEADRARRAGGLELRDLLRRERQAAAVVGPGAAGAPRPPGAPR